MIIKTKTLQAAADQAKKIVSSNMPTNIKKTPALGTIMIDVSISEQWIRLTSVNLDTVYQNTIKADCTTDSGAWSACVNAIAFTKILKAVNQDTIDLILSPGGELNIITEKTTYELPTINVKEFPKILNSVGPWIPVTSINSDDLKKLDQGVDRHDSNGILSCINYNPCGRFASCNGNLVIIFNGIKADCYNKEINLRCGLIKHLPTKTNLCICTDEDIIRLSNGDEHFYVVNLDSQFPPYTKHIPQHNDDTMSFDTIKLIVALKEVEITLNNRTSLCKFNFDIENQLIYLTSDTPNVGKTETRIETLCSDIRELKYTKIAFNHSYLKIATKLGDRVNFVLGPTSNLSCAKLTFDNDYTMILMPIQIK
jgi:DNA polymerase III sliding clamp (beta) subunit (PCNA family)